MTAPADALNPYVPGLVRRQLGVRRGPPTAPFADSLPGAALFVDISGSTAVADRLATRGSIGAEELSALFNAYFGRLIDLIAAHGGDVMRFAGDGLLALWAAERTEVGLGVLSRRAAQCGRAIQAGLHDYPVADGIRLSSRVGVGCGQVTIVHVGGVDGRWEYVVDGPPILQVARAQAQAQPGEVVLSSEAWGLMGAGEGHTLPTGDVCLESLDPQAGDTPPPPACADDDGPLRGYVSPPSSTASSPASGNGSPSCGGSASSSFSFPTSILPGGWTLRSASSRPCRRRSWPTRCAMRACSSSPTAGVTSRPAPVT